jgi:methyl-accepting chemotaxis protein I, serine sensor receptor
LTYRVTFNVDDVSSPFNLPSFIGMFKNTSIRVRLALAMGFLSALLIVVGVMGIVGVAMSNSDVQELYSSRLASSQALNRASVSLARARLWLFRIALDPTGSGIPQQAQAARDLVVVAKKAWEQYRALPFSGPDETSRAADVNSKLETLLSGGLEPMLNAISAHDSAKLIDVALHTPASMFIDVTNGMDALNAMQVSAAQATFDAAQARFHWFVSVAVVGILIALGAAMMAWWTLQRAICEPLARTLDHFNAIAGGDLTTRVEGKRSVIDALSPRAERGDDSAQFQFRRWARWQRTSAILRSAW